MNHLPVRITLLAILLTTTKALLPLSNLFESEMNFKSPFQSPTPQVPNEKKVDDIFNLLADIDHDPTPRSSPSDSIKLNQKPPKPPLSAEPLVDSVRDNSIDESYDPFFEIENLSETPSPDDNQSGYFDSYFDLANNWSKSFLMAGDMVDDLIGTVDKVSKIYEKQKTHIKPSQSTKNSTEPHPSTLVDVMLDPDTVENILSVGMTSQDEDEILQHLTNVLIGVEDRSGGYGGGGLTLDPVTVIALLTLAAYLIRAVYQILVVTGRSFDSDLRIPLGMADLPEAMVSLHNMISPTEIVIDRHRRELKEKKSKKIPTNLLVGDLAALIMLHRAEKDGCIRQFLCEQLVGKDLQHIGLSEATIVGIGYLYGDTSTFRYLDQKEEEGTCNRVSKRRCENFWRGKEDCSCHDEALNKARRLQRLYASIAEGISHMRPAVNAWYEDLSLNLL